MTTASLRKTLAALSHTPVQAGNFAVVSRRTLISDTAVPPPPAKDQPHTIKRVFQNARTSASRFRLQWLTNSLF